MSVFGYRPDIDGLRTIAVVPVVLFHAGLSGFSGGFIGVDVFFVISGYLITGILLKSISEDRFSVVDFYIRRIKRILPALLLILGLSTIAAWLIFPPNELQKYGGSLASVTIFASNFWFWQDVSYFANNAHVQPLLHTWSLAVEEQFYIFYPILILAVFRTRLNLKLVLLAIGILSLALSVLMLDRMPGAVFYLLPARAWELIVGGLLACGILPQARNSAGTQVLAGVGLAGILIPVVFYSPQTPFPGLAAIPPCLGTAALIWSGHGSSGPVYKLLSSRPFVIVGQVSYSLYLWHFPIFAFTTYLFAGTLDVRLGVMLALVSFVLSLATLFLVENPLRRSASKVAYILPLFLMLVIGFGGIVLVKSNGFPDRLDPQAARILKTAFDQQRHPSACMSNLATIIPPSRACVLGDDEAEPSILLWGDSHAMVVATAMEAAAIDAGASFKFAASADCPAGLGFQISPEMQSNLTKSPSYRYCGEYNLEMFALAVNDPSLRTVVLAARWTNWRIGESGNRVETPVDIRLEDELGMATSPRDNARIWEAGFLKLVQALEASGKRVVIIGPIPEPEFDVPQRLYVARFGLVPTPKPLTVADFQKRHEFILRYFSVLAKTEHVEFIWPHIALCHAAICPLIENGAPNYFDHNHLSVAGALKTKELYKSVFEVSSK